MYRRTYVGIASLALLLAGPALAHFEVVAPLIGFGLFMLAAVLGLVTTLWGIGSMLRQRSLAAYVPSTLGLPALVLLVIGALGSRGHPRINDISTDLVSPPPLSRAKAYPDAFKKVVAEHYSKLKPLALAQPAPTVFDRALALAKSRTDWSVVRVDEKALVFEGTSKTRLFRFVDDFVVRVRANGEGAIVDMRSRSRDGKGDLGKNAARIRAFFADLQAK